MPEVDKTWTAISAKLKDVIANDDVFASYIAVNRPVSIDDEKLVLEVDSEFLRDWIKDGYKGMIEDAVTLVTGTHRNVEWVVSGAGKSNDGNEPASGTNVDAVPVLQPIPPPPVYKRDPNCIGALNPDFTFDEFVVGSSNSFTHSAALGVVNNPGTAYNPLFIYGDTGLGKTHLMQAVGHEFLKKKRKVAYVTSEEFFNEFLSALQGKNPNEFRNKYRKVELLMIDDIQFFAGKPSLQEEFFNTSNALYQAHKQIIITSDRPASEVSGLEKRLVSRFNAGLSVEMESPNSEMRLAILRYKLAHQNVTIPDEAERFIAENVKSNVRNLEGAMKRVLAYKNLNSGATLGVDELRVILRDLIDEDQRENVTAEGIRKAVCDFYNVNIDDLNRDSRVQTIVIPRQVAMFLCRVLLKDSSLPSIARVFDRTHANIYFACTKIKKLYNTDEATRRNVQAILQSLGKTADDISEA